MKIKNFWPATNISFKEFSFWLQNLAALLHEAAEECSYVDPMKVCDILDVTAQERTVEKTTEEPSGNLTLRQVVHLAAAISADNMVAIAEGYMDIKSQTIKNIQVENKDDTDAFKREILECWRNKNPVDQVQVKGQPTPSESGRLRSKNNEIGHQGISYKQFLLSLSLIVNGPQYHYVVVKNQRPVLSVTIIC